MATKHVGLRAPGAAHTAAALGVATGITGLTLAAEVLWTAFRRLPQFGDLDPSGVVAAHLDSPPLRVVVLGDSTLTGPGLVDPDEIWVRRALAALDLGRPVEVVSFAVGGSRVADVARRLDAALAVDVDAAILSVGSNDAIHGTGSRQFAADFDTLLDAVLARVPVAAVTNIGDLGNVARFPAPLRGVMRRRGRSFCRIVEAAVARHPQAVLLDVTPSNQAFRDRRLFGPDLFHPTSAGHSLWAEAVAPSLRTTFARLDATVALLGAGEA
ncbi:MAG: SGNH/GDSL hydrolase family protein [Acidimicrobiales bacterium]